MKTKIFLFLSLIVGMSSCESMFDTDSTSVIVDKGQQLDSPNDSLYSAMGILSQVRNLGDRYVLLGELRGDLMSTTSNATVSLQEVSNLQMTTTNDYADATEYYKVINNCNYALARMDTTVSIYQTRVLVPEYAAIKTLRDWTYWQLALAYGEAAWIEKPIVTVEDATNTYSKVSMDVIAQNIINDLQPFISTRPLDYGTIDGYESSKMFYPVTLLLGDMYLYLNKYAEAAQMYYDFIYTHKLRISQSYANNWRRDNRSLVDIQHTQSYIGEMISGFMYSSDIREPRPSLIRLAYNEKPQIVPSGTFVNDMEHAMHFYADQSALTIGAYLEGDLRGQAVGSGNAITPSAFESKLIGDENTTRIYKYLLTASLNENGSDPQNTEIKGLYSMRVLPLMRVPQVYLRFAEALNRLGKPSIAFAILKYGLSKETIDSPLRVSPWELQSGEPFLNFSWIETSNSSGSVGTASRGRGRGVALDTQNFIIPATCATAEDSLLVVENYIVDEMAAETSFEGNRFFDLLRVAKHRNAFPEYLAEKVSKRFSDPQSAYQRLSNKDAWFLKRQKK